MYSESGGALLSHGAAWVHRIENSSDRIQHRKATANQRDINPERNLALRIASHGKRQQNNH